jgi:hypothetical protein
MVRIVILMEATGSNDFVSEAFATEVEANLFRAV